MKALTIVMTILVISACSIDSKERKLQQYISQGKFLYQQNCQNCHTDKGFDDAKLSPPLKDSDFFLNDPMATACYIKNGLEGKIIVNQEEFNIPMPANSQLMPDEIAKIICYIGNSWGNQIGFVSTDDVKRKLKSCGVSQINQ